MRTRSLLVLLFIFSPALQAESLRILHVTSYHLSWNWSDQQFQGFRDELKDLPVEYRVVELDGKRTHRTQTLKKAEQAIRMVEEWRPHLVYVNDDLAQDLVTRRFLNHSIPFVYSGVNNRPHHYGFEQANNVAGVLENEHFVPSLKLLRSIQPEIHRLAIITDSDPMWTEALVRLQHDLKTISGIEVVEWARPGSFAEFQKRVRDYQSSADAIAFLGVFAFPDKNGKTAGYDEVLRWTAQNSRLPDVSFWKERVEGGTLCAVAVSGIEQGSAAGKIARKILVDGMAPDAIHGIVATKGQPVISLARARDLGVNVPVQLLLASKVMTTYKWTK